MSKLNFDRTKLRQMIYEELVNELHKTGHKDPKGRSLMKGDKEESDQEPVKEAINPVKAARVIFDKLAFAKLIGKQNRRRAEGIIEFQLRAMNFGESVQESAPGYKHDCAVKVIHKEHGEGTCIPEKHTLVEDGDKHIVTHYDVKFKSGKVVEDIPVSELKIVTMKEHWHKGYKKKKKKEVKEAWIGPFVFSDSMSDAELKAMYQGALDGYANYSRGFQHPKSTYKKAYQAIEKILKKRGINEASNVWKRFDAIQKLQGNIMDIEDEMRDIANDLKQLHMDMEQEAEPGGGKVADRYGRDIEKKEKEYKKKRAEFKKLMKQLDKLEQF